MNIPTSPKRLATQGCGRTFLKWHTMAAMLVVMASIGQTRAIVIGPGSARTTDVWTYEQMGAPQNSSRIQDLFDSPDYDQSLSSSLIAATVSGSVTTRAEQNTSLIVDGAVGDYTGLHLSGTGNTSGEANISGNAWDNVGGLGLSTLYFRFVLFDATPFSFSASREQTTSSAFGNTFVWLYGAETLAFLGEDGAGNTGPDSATLSGILQPGGYELIAYSTADVHAAIGSDPASPARPNSTQESSFSIDLRLGSLVQNTVPEGGPTIALLGLSMIGFAALRQRR